MLVSCLKRQHMPIDERMNVPPVMKEVAKAMRRMREGKDRVNIEMLNAIKQFRTGKITNTKYSRQ